jgi:WD40 repeat protein
MIFSRDGSVLVTTQSGRTLHIWHAPTGTLRHSIEAHTDVIWDLDLSPDGSTLASVSRDNTAKLWSTADGRLLRVIHPQGEDVRSVSFAPDGETLATMTWTSGSSVQIWDVPTGRVLVTLELGGSAMAFSPDGATLAAVGKGNCCVRLYDARTWQLRSTVTGHTDLIWELMFSPDGRTFATASWDSTVRLWSTSTGQLLAKFAGEQGMYWSLSWSSDGRFLAAVRTGGENSLVVWEAAPQENADEDPEGVHLWATALERQGQAELAEQYLRGAWAAQRAKRGEQHAWSAAAMLDLGTLLTNRRESRDYPEAEDLLLRARSAF